MCEWPCWVTCWRWCQQGSIKAPCRYRMLAQEGWCPLHWGWGCGWKLCWREECQALQNIKTFVLGVIVPILHTTLPLPYASHWSWLFSPSVASLVFHSQVTHLESLRMQVDCSWLAVTQGCPGHGLRWTAAQKAVTDSLEGERSEWKCFHCWIARNSTPFVYTACFLLRSGACAGMNWWKHM